MVAPSVNATEEKDLLIKKLRKKIEKLRSKRGVTSISTEGKNTASALRNGGEEMFKIFDAWMKKKMGASMVKQKRWSSLQGKFDQRKPSADLTEFLKLTEARNQTVLGKLNKPNREMIGQVMDLFEPDTQLHQRAKAFTLTAMAMEVCPSWNEFKQHMINETTDFTMLQLVSKFNDIEMEKEHSVYILEFEKYMGKFKEDPEKTLDTMYLFHYLKGLKSKYRDYVQDQNVTTLKDALEAGRTFASRINVSGAARNNVISEPTNENGKHGKRKRNTEDKFNKKSKTDTLNLKNRCLRCGNLSHKTEGCFTRDSKVKAFIAECKKANIKVPNETNNPRAERSGVSNYFCSANNATRMNYIRNTNNVHTDDHTMAFLRVDIQSNTKQPKFGQCFIDCGSSFDAISTKYAEKCGLTVTKYDSRPLKITLGGERKIEVPRCVAEMNINIQGVGAYRAHCFVLENIPENKDVLLGMPFLQHVNPEINWIDGSISAPQRSLEEVMAYHKVVEFVGSSGSTRVINPRQFEQLCKRNTDDGYLFSLQLKATEKVARQTDTGWDTLIDHPLYELLVKYKSSVFSETNPATESLQTKVEHSIDLKNKDPVSSRNYRLSNEQLKALEQWTKEMLAAGLIRPSTSPYSSPILVIRKPIGWRIVHDYRAINAVTNIPQSVIPRREAIVDAMVNSHWFTAMDLRSGYYQIPLRESDRHITAFSLPSGQYEYTVMAQGLSGAPATFNRIMQKIFAGMDTAKAFFDDIFVYTKSKDVAVHSKALEEVLEKLKLNNLRVKIEKCVFLADEIPVLGDFVGRNGVRMDPDKISIIRDWPI
ncbi:MAG: hypothetical protein RLZZ155_1220, partial [Bacteroidota bacterium]